MAGSSSVFFVMWQSVEVRWGRFDGVFLLDVVGVFEPMSGDGSGNSVGWSQDRWLRVVGVVIVGMFVVGMGVVVLAGWAAPGGTEAPNAEWDLVRHSGPYVSIVHAGGEPIESEDLIVVVDGVKRQVEWGEPVVDDGVSGRVQVSEGMRVQLYFHPGSGGRVLLSNWLV